MKLYKLKGSYTVHYKHDCDCEWCDFSGGYDEPGKITEEITANSLEEATEKMKKAIADESYGAKNIVIDLLDSWDLPDDKYPFIDRKYLVGGRFYSDGYVAIEISLGYVHGEIDQELELGEALGSLELDSPLGRFARDEKHAYFHEAVFNVEFVSILHAMGVSIWKQKGQVETSPFGLEKDGLHVGVIMPMHGWVKDRHRQKVIAESGLFLQPVAIQAQETQS